MYTSSAQIWLLALIFFFTAVNTTKVTVNWTLEPLQYHLKALNEATGSHCLPIEEPSCLGLEYTHTYLPNIIGLTSQAESTKRIRDYSPLLKLGCSTYLEFFLCSVYFPMCTQSMGEQVLLRPCASFCNHVRQRCAPLMLRFNFSWPEELACSKLPTDDEMCIRPQSFESDTHLPLTSVFSYRETVRYGDGALKPNSSLISGFTIRQKEIARYCLIACGSLNALFCLISISLYMFNRNRFLHPLLPLVFLTNACMLELISYLPQLIFRRTSFSNTDYRIASISCMVQFALAYYARTAVGIWFDIVSLSWFLSACKGWAPEAIQGLDRWFHVLGWVTSLLPPMCILVFRRIDVDDLTNSCYIGYSDKTTYFLLVILPEAGFLLVGVMFLSSTFASLVRFHGELKNLHPALPILTTKAIRASVDQRRLLKAVNRVILTVMFVAGPLLSGTICDLWQYFDNTPGRMAVRLLKAISVEMVGIGATLVLWCNHKTFPILYSARKNQKPLDVGNLIQFRPIAPATKESRNSMSVAPLARSQHASATEHNHPLFSHMNQNESTAMLSFASLLQQPPMQRLVSPRNEAKLRNWLHDTLEDSSITSTSYSSPCNGV
uniref:Frizzled 4 n=1 Tax=Echinococcus granulosus TaxID=6210 RepID=A0A068WH60_ECHGR|nr:frizzled 4 [Echinococcus granulosus]